MELHVPHGSIRSIKDFLVHIGVVTVGIIIALGLGQLVEARHRSRMAAETMAGFGREITFAEAQVKDVVDAIPAWRNQIETEIAKLSATPSQSAPQEPIRYPGTAYQLIRKASWETAIATLHGYGENAATLSAEDRHALIKELRRYDAFTRFLESLGKDALKTCANALK